MEIYIHRTYALFSVMGPMKNTSNSNPSDLDTFLGHGSDEKSNLEMSSDLDTFFALESMQFFYGKFIGTVDLK